MNRLQLIRSIILVLLGTLLIVDYALRGVGRDVELIAGLVLLGVVPVDELIRRNHQNHSNKS